MTAASALKPCGTVAAYVRHHSRGERVDAACRAASRAASQANRAQARKSHAAADRAAIEAEVRAANRRVRREVRVVRLPDGRVFGLGAYAGTDRLHVFVPDGGTSTSCQLCFGWSNDYRHTSTVMAVGRG